MSFELLNLSAPLAWLSYLVLGAFTYATWQRPYYGILIISALLPSYLIRPRIGDIPTTLLELFIIILFGVWFLKDSKFKKINWRLQIGPQIYNPIPQSFRAPLALLLISGVISLFMSPNALSAIGIFKAYFLEPMLFLIVFAYEIKTEKELRTVMYCLGSSVILLAAWNLVQFITGLGISNPFWQNREARRATSIFGYPNAASLFATPIAAWFMGLFSGIQRKNFRQTLFYVTVIAGGLIIILTSKTTGALIGLATAFVWYVWHTRKLRKPALFACAAVAILLCFLWAGKPETQKIFTSIQSNYLDLNSTSLEIRINQWRETLQLLSDKPLFGAGMANYQNALVPYHTYSFLEIYLYPHNIFLNFWVELGMMGLIAILWLGVVIFKTLRQAFQKNNTYAVALSCAWIALVIHGLVDVPYFKNDLSVLFMIFVAITIKILTVTQPLQSPRH